MELKNGEREIFVIHKSISIDKWVECSQICNINKLLLPELMDLKDIFETKLVEINKEIVRQENSK